jgi:hypothetical protein
MFYQKPQIIEMDAAKIIQGDEKGDCFTDNNPPPPSNATASAYQADE